MIKSFVLIATSIACIFSVAHISEVEAKISNRQPNRQGTCDNQKSIPIQNSDISIADVKAICQLITNHYKQVNGNFLKHQLFIQNNPGKVRPGIRTSSIRFTDVTNLNLLSYTNKIGKNASINAKIQIVLNSAVYDWISSKNTWELDKSLQYSGTKIEVELYKRNGKWSRDPKNIYWNGEIKESIESNQEDS